MIRVQRKELRQALSVLRKAIGASRTLSILECVRLLPLGDGCVRLDATDLECTASVLLKGEGRLAESVCIPVKALTAAVPGGKGVDPKVRLESASDHQLRVDGVVLRGLSADDYPTLPDVGDTDTFASVSAGALRDAWARAVYAASTDDTRYNLRTLLAEPGEGGGVRFVATDGHRLAWTELDMTFPFRPEGQTLLPAPFVQAVAASIGARETWGPAATLRRTGNSFAVRLGELKWTARLVTDGEFLHYRQVLPDPSRVTWTVTVDPAAVLAALRELRPVLPERSRAVRLTVSGAGLRLHTSRPDIGEGERDVPATTKGTTELGINARYLEDALAVVPEVPVTLWGSNPESPIQVGEYAVVMPMRL